MATDIDFLDTEPRYDGERDCLVFRAREDGKPVDCFVTAEFLFTHFGARDLDEEALRDAYRAHQAEIQAIARNHIENGWIDEDGCLYLTKRFTRLSATFGNRLSDWAVGRTAAQVAHRQLTELIGPTAEKVSIEWDGEEPFSDQARLRLRIGDPTLPFSVKVFVGPREWQDRSKLLFLMADAWGTVLRARSRKLMLQSG